MGGVRSKIRIYDLAKDLWDAGVKIDTKRLIEEVRREGVDVSVPSNSISKDLAGRIREKYFPKKKAVAKRAIKAEKKAKGARRVDTPPRKTFTIRRQHPPAQRCKNRDCRRELVEKEKKSYGGLCYTCYCERHQPPAVRTVVQGGSPGLPTKLTLRIGKTKATSNEVARWRRRRHRPN